MYIVVLLFVVAKNSHCCYRRSFVWRETVAFSFDWRKENMFDGALAGSNLMKRPGGASRDRMTPALCKPSAFSKSCQPSLSVPRSNT